jgi:hypothetical protein
VSMDRDELKAALKDLLIDRTPAELLAELGWSLCPECRGEGKVTRPLMSGGEWKVDCPPCFGRGWERL